VSSPPHILMLMRGMQGFGALYAGVLPALISVAPSGAVFYGTYDLLKVHTGPLPGAPCHLSCATGYPVGCRLLR
jgi:Mitochondrial carrier protein